ncbi:DUF4870 domain-containing protein [Geosporobacter ferrireducens]|uniref:Orotate phosphoribosyltransferase n=1 Tax=Geosporobacter ferrireducens TaxID=1424294 RepID=A0A1D8GFM2_9FIRM|nr:DUF4870 domain-containing protein [Geosporobacter ferrireducens]AOT69697.1 hypothetical protein Gferi_08950 [Geosporobacter ferrireducens]MTI54596.1 DUF4870 domain-containing protein [Geosporobacter ferrireducens]
MLTTEQKLLCGVAHLGWVVGAPILAPLIIMLLAGDSFVKNQAKEALAFQIGAIILGAIFAVLSIVLIGIPLLMALALGTLILPIIAIVKVCDGIDYSYPITGKFIRDNF